MIDVAVLQLGVDVDVIRPQYPRVLDGLEDGLLEDGGEERVLVRRLIATDERLEAFLLAEHPVEEAAGAVAYVDAASLVNGPV